MTTIAKRWQIELRIQAKMRKRIAQAQGQYEELVKERVRVLKVGGKGWATRLATVNVRIEQKWDQVRTLLLKLYSRKVPV